MFLLNKMKEIHSCLEILVKVDSDVLDTGLLSIFRTIDYAAHGDMLEFVIEKLDTIIAELDESSFSEPKFKTVSDDAIAYALALENYAAALLKLTKGLGENAEGNFSAYPKAQYKEDLNSMIQLQDNYSILGSKLNVSYNLVKRSSLK